MPMTRSTLLVVILVAMNFALLVSNGLLVYALKGSGQRDSEEVVAALRNERARLSAEVARLADRLSVPGAASAGAGVPAEAAAASSAQVVPVVAAGADGEDVPFERPAMDTIPLLTDAEKAELSRMAAALPRLPAKLLLQCDIDALVASPEWNPGGRQLMVEERRELGRLLAEHKYFARDSHQERYNTMIAPEVPRLRDAGAYIEYKVGEAPPAAAGVKISHAERYSADGIRMYLFRPDDYPDLYHHQAVAEERAKETYVKVYQLLNGTR